MKNNNIGYLFLCLSLSFLADLQVVQAKCKEGVPCKLKTENNSYYCADSLQKFYVDQDCKKSAEGEGQNDPYSSEDK